MFAHASLLLFAMVFALAAMFPGPVQTALVARVLAKGRSGIGWYVAGIVIGNACWLTLAVLGLTAVAVRYATLFAVIKWLGLAYLVFMGCMLWLQSPPEAELGTAAPGASGRIVGFASALALSLGNPKALIFYGALLPQIFDLTAVTPSMLITILAVQIGVDTAIQCAYVFLASRLRRAVRNARQMRLARRVAGSMMLGVAATVAARSR